MRLQNQNIHIRIQAKAMIGQESIIHAEYPILPMQMKVDLLNSLTGEVWEIKPWADQVQAKIDLNSRIISLQIAKSQNLLRGKNPIAMPYDWNYHPSLWFKGISFSKEVYIGSDETGQYQIWAGQLPPGVILWWKYKNPKPVPVEIPIFLPYPMKNSERNVRPNWSPQPSMNPQPVYSNIGRTEEILEVSGIMLFLYVLYKIGEACINPALPFITP